MFATLSYYHLPFNTKSHSTLQLLQRKTMVTLFFTSHTSLSSCNLHTHHYCKKINNVGSTLSFNINDNQTSNLRCLPFSTSFRLKPLRSSVKDEQETESNSFSSSVVVASEEPHTGHRVESSEEMERKEDQQEMDWKSDKEFKKFMGNPSIEAAIKLEKKAVVIQ